MAANKKYSVSVIIPVYNAEKYLKKCIESVLAQTLQDIEIILVNDGSTDCSAKILSKYAEKYNNIKVIHQQNSGPAIARNAGLENATGEYIGFVDCDDYIESNMYETLYNTAIQNKIDVVISDYYNVQNDIKTHQGHFKIPKNQIINKEDIYQIISIANESRILWFAVKGIYKTDIIKKNNIFYPSLKLGEETVFVLECLLSANSMYYINEPFYYYVQTPNSLTRVKYKENLLHQLEGLYFSKKEIFKKYNFVLCDDDMNSYTMKHTIPLLLSNEIGNNNASFNDKIRCYKNIRNSEMIKAAYKTSSVNLIKSKLKYMAILLKFKLYFLLAIITI